MCGLKAFHGTSTKDHQWRPPHLAASIILKLMCDVAYWHKADNRRHSKLVLQASPHGRKFKCLSLIVRNGFQRSADTSRQLQPTSKIAPAIIKGTIGITGQSLTLSDA